MFNKVISVINHRVNSFKIRNKLRTKDLRVYGNNITIFNSEAVKLGNYCSINQGVLLHGGGEDGGGIEIGNNVTISAYTQIYSYQLDTTEWSTNYLEKKHVGKKVFINDGAWIGAGTIIVPGVQIKGIGVIVAAGSVVTKDIDEDFVLVAGNPARIVKRY